MPVGYHDLLRDLRSPGCPVCRGAGRAAWRRVGAILWEFVDDPGVRRHLRDAHGFCREHALMAVDVAAAQAGASGMAVLYEDILRHVRDEAVAAARGRRRRRAAVAHGRCPACESAAGVAEAYLRLLAVQGADTEVGRAAREAGRWLCLPHLVEGLWLVQGPEATEGLLDLYLRAEGEVRADLREYLRKRDYRYRHEPRGREAGAWLRAVWLTVGAPLPRRDPGR